MQTIKNARTSDKSHDVRAFLAWGAGDEVLCRGAGFAALRGATKPLVGACGSAPQYNTNSIDVLEELVLDGEAEGVYHFVKLAEHKFVEGIQRQSYAVVGDAPLRDVVVPTCARRVSSYSFCACD